MSDGATMLEFMKTERDGEVLIVTLNRADKRNALSAAFIEEIYDLFEWIRRSDEVRAVVVRAEGGHFCAGLDLIEHHLERRSASDFMAICRRWHAAFDAIQHCGKPVIGALNGAVVGGGLELAGAFHIRVADATTYFALPEGQRGIFTGGGATVRVARLVGEARMIDMMLTGRTYAGDEAVAVGLCQYHVAGSSVDKAIEIDPNNSDAHNNRGLMWVDKGDYDRAIADYDAALGINPQNASAFHNRGVAWAYKGDDDRAIADLDQSIKFDPRGSAHVGDRGLAWERKGDDDRALVDYNQAIALGTLDAKYYRHRGGILAVRGDFPRALADYDKALGLDPKYDLAYFDRGLANFYAGELARALTDLAQVVALRPEDAYAAIWLDLAERGSGAPSHLREAEGKLDMTKWPAPIIRMLLGDKTSAETLAAAENPNLETKRGQVCETNF